ncbi:hypothetical protein I204_05419 [Kwoniella mangroviensis CBS 8886]|nr:hypothetical protein I204_05419 [Kwoniella mangroviensis CBS 8886]
MTSTKPLFPRLTSLFPLRHPFTKSKPSIYSTDSSDTLISSASSRDSSPSADSSPKQSSGDHKWTSEDLESYFHRALNANSPRSPSPSLTISYEEAMISVGWQMDNPYILTGYRQALGSVRGCVYSIYGYSHNETFNILTHLVGSIMFLIILSIHILLEPLSSTTTISNTSSRTGAKYNLADILALSVYLVACTVCLGMSASFHTLNCHSARISHRAHRCDYAGIVVLGVGSILPVIHHAFYDEMFWQLVYSGIIIITGMISAFIVLSKEYRRRRILRTSTFLFLGCSATTPIVHIIVHEGYHHAKQSVAVDWIFKAGFTYILGAAIYATRYPERLHPGKFDIFFSSHQIFHSLVVILFLQVSRTRGGDQRERDRAKKLKEEAAKGKKLSGSPQARREADAKAVAEKQAAKAKARAEAEARGEVASFDKKVEQRKVNAQQKK